MLGAISRAAATLQPGRFNKVYWVLAHETANKKQKPQFRYEDRFGVSRRGRCISRKGRRGGRQRSHGKHCYGATYRALPGECPRDTSMVQSVHHPN